MRILALILAACAAMTLDSPSPAAPPAPPSGEMRLSHISVVKFGSGTPIVLIPGLASPRSVWNGVTEELGSKHTVYAVQVNGFAGDPIGSNSGERILDGVVEEIHAMLQRDRSGSAKIVGHSMGGLIGMMLASKHPEDVDKLMIVDALPFAGAMFDPNATAESVQPMAAMLKARMSAGYVGATGEAAAQATADGLTAKAESAGLVKDWILKADPKVAAQTMAEDLVTDMRPLLPKIATPMVVVHPAEALGHDAAATEAFYKSQFKGAANADFIAVPDSGHFIMLDQPARFLELLRSFAG